jgi:hypothetical protein
MLSTSGPRRSIVDIEVSTIVPIAFLPWTYFNVAALGHSLHRVLSQGTVQIHQAQMHRLRGPQAGAPLRKAVVKEISRCARRREGTEEQFDPKWTGSHRNSLLAIR